MIPFHMKAESGASETLELILDMQGRSLVGYYISSDGDAIHTLDVSHDRINFYNLDTITFSKGGKQTAIGREIIPWRYVRLKTLTKEKHYYELSAK